MQRCFSKPSKIRMATVLTSVAFQGNDPDDSRYDTDSDGLGGLL